MDLDRCWVAIMGAEFRAEFLVDIATWGLHSVWSVAGLQISHGFLWQKPDFPSRSASFGHKKTMGETQVWNREI